MTEDPRQIADETCDESLLKGKDERSNLQKGEIARTESSVDVVLIVRHSWSTVLELH